MVKIAIIVGSTRPGRVGGAVAQWVYQQSKSRTDATFEIVDIADFNLPLLDEPYLPAIGPYTKEHTKAWSKKIKEFHGYIFVTPEYNHSTSAALKNALDYLYSEWANKSAGFVSYGGIGGARAVESLRPIMAQFLLADVPAQVMLSTYTDFKNGVFTPDPRHEASAQKVFDQVIAWASALKVLRDK